MTYNPLHAIAQKKSEEKPLLEIKAKYSLPGGITCSGGDLGTSTDYMTLIDKALFKAIDVTERNTKCSSRLHEVIELFSILCPFKVTSKIDLDDGKYAKVELSVYCWNGLRHNRSFDTSQLNKVFERIELFRKYQDTCIEFEPTIKYYLGNNYTDYAGLYDEE